MAIDEGYTITPLSGKNGTNGQSLSVEYSVNGSTNWHSTFTNGDVYMRQSTDGGTTWSDAMKIVGEEGKNAITMTSATTPSGEYNGQIGFWQGKPYMWNGSTWVKQIGDLPTDAVLHYSFDDVPDYPDGTADVRLLDNNTYDIQSTNYKLIPNGAGTTNRNVNGNLQVEITGGSSTGDLISNTYVSGKILKFKIKITSIIGTLSINSGYNNPIATFTKEGEYEVTCYHNSTAIYPSFYFFCNGSGNSCTFELLKIYIGDGSYSTPIIDNANGQNNATNNGGIAVQGVSGKGVSTFNKNARIVNNNFQITPPYTYSLWIKFNEDFSTVQKIVDGRNQSNSSQQGYDFGLGIYLNKSINVGTSGTGDDFYSSENVVPINEWFFLTVSVELQNGQNIYKLYKNGILLNTFLSTHTPLNKGFSKLTIDNYYTIVNIEQVARQVDDFLFFNRALSETEVQALYQNKANTPKYYDLSDYSIEQIDDDNVVDHLTEKPQLLSKWLEIYNAKNVSSSLPTSNVSASGEYKGVIDSSNEVGVIETDAVQAYITASNALRSALWGTNGYLVDMNKDSALSGSLDSLFSTYRQTLQKARTVISEQQASSASALTIVNSNPFCLIPVNAGGTVTTYENTGLRLQVFNGVTQLTPKTSSATLSEGQWKVTANGSNITAGSQTVGNGYIDFGNVSALNADTAVITFTITALVNGVTNTLYTTQKFSKSKEGADGRIYSLQTDTGTIVKADSGTLTPSSVTVKAYSWTGSSSPALYGSGDLKAYENNVQVGSTVSQGNTITVSPTGSYPVVIKLFVHGTNTLLDTLTIPVLQEVKGDTGRGLVSSVDYYKLSSNVSETFDSTTINTWTDSASSSPTAQLPYLHHAVLQTYSEAPLNEYGDDVIIREYVTNGANGTSTRYSSASATSSTTSIALNTITGNTAVVGDVIIANSLLFVVTAVGSTNATVQYKQSLKGADNKGISVLLSNQNPNVPSNSDGSSPVLTNTLTNVRVYENTTELKYDASSTANGYYKITVTATGCTHTSITDKGDYAQVNAISAMSADSATRNLAISGKRSDGTSFSFNVVQTITKEKQGLDGYSPSASVTKSGGVATITVTDKTGTTQETVSDGEDNKTVSVILSAPNVSVPANTDGSSPTLSSTSTTVRVYQNKTELTYDGTGTSNGTWKMTVDVTGCTGKSITDSGTYATLANITAMANDSATRVMTITGKLTDGTAFTTTVTQTFSKNKKGDTGDPATTWEEITEGGVEYYQITQKCGSASVYTYKVSKSGTLVAENAVISGTVYATAGSFAGDIVANSFTLGENATITKGQNDDQHSYFGLASDGTLTVRNLNAINGTFSGIVNANGGVFTGTERVNGTLDVYGQLNVRGTLYNNGITIITGANLLDNTSLQVCRNSVRFVSYTNNNISYFFERMTNIVNTIDSANSYFTSASLLTATIQGVIGIQANNATSITIDLMKLRFIRENGELLRNKFILVGVERQQYYQSSMKIYSIILRQNSSTIELYQWIPSATGSFDVNASSNKIGNYNIYRLSLGY